MWAKALVGQCARSKRFIASSWPSLWCANVNLSPGFVASSLFYEADGFGACRGDVGAELSLLAAHDRRKRRAIQPIECDYRVTCNVMDVLHVRNRSLKAEREWSRLLGIRRGRDNDARWGFKQ